MRRRNFFTAILSILCMLTACGGDGGGVSNPSVTLTSSYPGHSSSTTGATGSFALANNSDPITLTADVTNSNGSPAADGTVVVFNAAEGTFSPSNTTTTSGGTATVTLTHGTVAGASNATVTVAASALSVSSNAVPVKFINQPTAMDVFVALTPMIRGVTSLGFTMGNTAGISGPVAPPTIGINEGIGGSAATIFDADTNVSTVGYSVTPPTTITTVDMRPFIKITYTVSSGLPTFAVDSGFPIIFESTPAFGLAESNIVLSWTYNTE